MEIFVV